jgi:hypothetical protein
MNETKRDSNRPFDSKRGISDLTNTDRFFLRMVARFAALVGYKNMITASGLIDRYLKGNPPSRAERTALARQMKSATKAAQALSLAKAEAAKACHDWQPVQPRVGWVAFCYVKRKCVWRVLHNGEIHGAYTTEADARQAGARLAADANAEWRGKVANPDA